MQYLINNDIEKRITDEISKSESFSIAVAWAEAKNNVFNCLMANKHKLDKFVVGISFSHTDPDIFSRLRKDGLLEKCRVYDKSNLFHPKIYLFKYKNNRWGAVIGSANLTSAAFESNVERAIYVTGELKNGNEEPGIFSDIDRLFHDGVEVTDDFISEYSKLYKKTMLSKALFGLEPEQQEWVKTALEELRRTFPEADYYITNIPDIRIGVKEPGRKGVPLFLIRLQKTKPLLRARKRKLRGIVSLPIFPTGVSYPNKVTPWIDIARRVIATHGLGHFLAGKGRTPMEY